MRLNVAISQLLVMCTIHAVLCQDFEIQMPLFHSKTVIDVNPRYIDISIVDTKVK